MTDVVIIGGGPAGATAAIYTARAGFETVLIYKDFGALEKAERVDNFYGFTKTRGKVLVEKGLRQARQAGAGTILGEVVGIRSAENGRFTVETTVAIFEGKAILLATGATRRTPKIQGLAELEGRGVSYCAICDGFFYRGKDIAVLGNGAYALHEVEDLLPLASSVTLLTNGENTNVDFPDNVTVRTEKVKEAIGGEASENNSSIPGLMGLTLNSQKKVFKGVILENGENLPLSGLFIAVGIVGGTELARKIGATLDPQGSIIADREMRTSVQGLWAAGDCTGGMKQIAKAVYEGAEAGTSIKKFLQKNS